MSDLGRQLTGNLSRALDNYSEHALNADPQSLEDTLRYTPLTLEMMISQWAAHLDIKTRHDMMKSSISAIR